MKKPLISIIVPVYNAEKYLSMCVESIRSQTYENTEILLIDDGSTDKSKMICDSYANKDKRIKVIHTSNGGVSKARNIGIQESKGSYISFVDSDDIIEPNFISKLFSLLSKGNYQVAQVATQLIDETGKKIDKRFVYQGKRKNLIDGNFVLNKVELIRGLLLRNIQSAVWCNLFERSFFDGVRFTVGAVNEDVLMWADGIEKVTNAIISNECLYNYRQLDTGITGKVNLKLDKDAYDHAKLWLKKVEKKYPQLLEEAYFNYFMCLWQIIKANGKYNDLTSEIKEVRNNIKQIIKNKYLGIGHKGAFIAIFLCPKMSISKFHAIMLQKISK